MLGTWIKRERDRHGWNQSELARRIGVSSAYINQLESGKRFKIGADVAQALALVFGVTVEEVLAGNTLPPALAQLEAEGASAENLEDLLQIWHTLTPEDQETAIALTRSLAERAKKRTPRVNGQAHSATG